MLTFTRRGTGLFFGLLAIVATVGCNGSVSPTAPSMVLTGGSALSGQSATVIDGTLLESGGTGAEGIGGPRLSGAAADGITVTVVGTNISVITDANGRFLLVNVPSGELQLLIQGDGINATITLQSVGSSQHIKITVVVDSTTAQLIEDEREELDEVEGIVASVDRFSDSFTLVDGTTIATDVNTWWDTGGDLRSFDQLVAAHDRGELIEIEGRVMLTDAGVLLAIVIKAETDEDGLDEMKLEIKPDEWRTDWATGSSSGSGDEKLEARIEDGRFADINPIGITMEGPDGAIAPVATEFDDERFEASFLKIDAIGIVASVPVGTKVTITVRGAFTDGTLWELTDTIEIEEHDDDKDFEGDFEEAIEDIRELIEEIDELVKDGFLSSGNANSLTSKLENVIKSLETGNVTPAINELGAFINEVEAFVKTGKLPEKAGEELIEDAQEIIKKLQGDDD